MLLFVVIELHSQYQSILCCEKTLTPVPSSGLHRDRAGDRLDSMSLPVKSSSDSSKDEAEDKPMEEELDSFLGDRISAGDPPQPLSEQGDSSSG